MNRACALVAALASGLTLAACSGGVTARQASSSGDGNTSSGAGDVITIASANFPEAALLAEIYTAALEGEGMTVEQRLNIGTREIYLAGLEDGSIDLVPEYTGALTLFLDPTTTATAPFEVYADLQAALPSHLAVLNQSEVQDKDSIVVTKSTAAEYGLSAIGDLEAVAGGMVLGGPREFETRPDGVPGLREVYGLDFSAYRPLVPGSAQLMQALASGQVDAANIYSTDPSILANDFIVLADPEALFVAQNIVPLVTKEANTPLLSDTLNEVSAALETDELVAMLAQVQIDGADPADIAQTFVDTNLD